MQTRLLPKSRKSPLLMIMTPPSGTDSVIHTFKACKTAWNESERQGQADQAESDAERLMRKGY